MSHLTEQSLDSILEALFPEEEINKQEKWETRRKADYAIHTFLGHLETSAPKVWKDISRYFNDHPEDLGIDPVKLLIEFDGPHHYTDPLSVDRDRKTHSFKVDWEEVENLVFLLRIPYWIQLDTSMIKFLFNENYDFDFSNNFPHGFISPKCILPANFCGDGEDRFLQELQSVPKLVQEQVINSILEKIKIKGRAATISTQLLTRLKNLDVFPEL